jgi:two-component system, LytTR family, response regulator
MKIVILDDEIPSAELLHLLIQKYHPDLEVIAVENKADVAIKSIQKYKPDLVFLDINIANTIVFDILHQIDGYYKGIIFVTAHEEYAAKSYKIGAIDYLLKPIDPSDLSRSITKARQALATTDLVAAKKAVVNGKISVTTAKGVRFIETEEIIRMVASKTYTDIILQNGTKMVTTKNIGKMEEEMKADYHFFRTHKSHLINLQYIREYHKNDGGIIILKNGDKVPVSRDKKKGFLKMISL